MQKENILKRRCQQTLYSIYDEYLEAQARERFHEVKEADPYVSQIVDEVIDFIAYELPLQDYIIDALRGKKNVKC